MESSKNGMFSLNYKESSHKDSFKILVKLAHDMGDYITFWKIAHSGVDFGWTIWMNCKQFLMG